MIYQVSNWTVPFNEFGLDTLNKFTGPYLANVRVGEDLVDADGEAFRIVSISHIQDDDNSFYKKILYVVNESCLGEFAKFNGEVIK